MNRAKYNKTPGGHSYGQNIPEVMYKRRGKNIVDVTTLIRSIQRAEGSPDCFRRPEKQGCTKNDCSWRLYCVKG